MPVVVVDGCLRYGEDLSRTAAHSSLKPAPDENRRRHVEPGPRPRSDHDVCPTVLQVQI